MHKTSLLKTLTTRAHLDARVDPKSVALLERSAPVTTPVVMTDREACTRYCIGMHSWLDLQTRPDFPAALWIGPRMKRHVIAETDAFMASLRTRPHGSFESTMRAANASIAVRRNLRGAQ